jgi:predicted DNA-binding transcriptional regulator AlpA
MPDTLIPRVETAKIVGVNARTLDRWARLGKFPPAVKLGPRSVMWPASSVQKFIDEAKAKAVGPSATRTGPGNEPESLAV